METRHVQFSYADALYSKKELLASQINLLEILRRLKNYRLLRRKEIATKNTLDRELKALRVKFGVLQTTFPEAKSLDKQDKRKDKSKSLDLTLDKDLSEELAHIQEKLAKLSGK